MNKITIEDYEAYLKEVYTNGKDQSLFMKLIEEIGEVAEILNIRDGRKVGNDNDEDMLAYELVDVIHYVTAIAAINNIDLSKAILEKDRKASEKYHHKIDLENYIKNNTLIEK